jgi:hypothetical protein
MPLTQVASGLIESGAALANIGTGNITPAYLSQPLTRDTAKASTSGTSVDFTGIPSWVRRITVMYNGVSTNGASAYMIQLGDSGGFETTGYSSVAQTSNVATTSTSGLLTMYSTQAAGLNNGVIIITNVSGNIWVTSGITGYNSGPGTSSFAGNKTLSDTLTQIRITTVNGTDTFDAGSINILYE